MQMKDKRIVSIVCESVRFLVETVAPLFGAAYAARVLGVSRLGLFSRSLTIVSYFTIPVSVGVHEYGARECVRYADDRAKLEAAISQILLIQLAAGALMFVCCGLVLFGLGHTEMVFLIQMLRIIAAMSDVSWVFRGLEAFAKLSRIRIRMRTAALVLTFLLVKPGRRPLETYTLIQALSLVSASLLQGALLYRNGLRFTFIPEGIGWHFRPLIFIFVPSFALQIFYMMDRTMLGLMCEPAQLGLYSAADRYIHIPMGMMSSMFTIMMPQAFRLRDRKGKLSDYLSRTLEIVLLAAVILGGVLGGCAKSFFDVFYGEEYALCGRLALYLLPAVFLGAAGEWYRKLYLIPQGSYKQDMLSVVCGMAVNLAVNMRMIPKYGAAGAAVGTVAAGTVLLFVQRADHRACRISPGLPALPRLLCAILLYAGMGRWISALSLSSLQELVLRLAGGGLLALLCFVCLLDRNTLDELLYGGIDMEETDDD